MSSFPTSKLLMIQDEDEDMKNDQEENEDCIDEE